jgi:hypothetical protein
MATTAQEALLAELLGDVGKLHDQIKALPEAFKEQIAPHLGALVQASAKATTAIDSAGKAKLSALDNQAAQLRIDMQKEYAGYREATKEALRQEVTATVKNAAATMEGARRSIMGPVWIAAGIGGLIGGTVVTAVVWLVMGGPA